MEKLREEFLVHARFEGNLDPESPIRHYTNDIPDIVKCREQVAGEDTSHGFGVRNVKSKM